MLRGSRTVSTAHDVQEGRHRKDASEALAAINGATPIDAIAMASAAQRGDVVYTTDVSDPAKLAGYFRALRALSIG